MAKVLVTCVGSGVGQSIVDSLNLYKKHKIVGIDANRNVYAFHFCDYFFTAPSIYSEGYLEFLLELSLKENIDLIIPGHDYELLLLSSNIQKFNDKKIQVLVSRPDIIKVSRDKLLWYNYFIEHGCPIVPTFRVKNFKKKPNYEIFPAIVKPSGGSASQGISILNDIKELNSVSDEDIIQPYLFPTKDDPNYETIQKTIEKGKFVQMSEISIQLIFSYNSEFKGIFISKNVLKNGVPVHVNPIHPDEFEYIDDIMTFVPICIEKKVKGPVNIQGRITEKGLVCFEMNMRFTGITGNRMQLGFNEVPFLVNDFLGFPTGELQSYALNKYGVRQVASTTIFKENIDRDKSLVITVLGAGSKIGSGFVHELVKYRKYRKIFLICRDQSYDKYLTLFPFERIEILKLSEKKEEYAYCNSDVVVNIASALAFKKNTEIYDATLFQYQQVQKISKSNVSLVINISSQSVYNQQADTLKKETDSVDISDAYSFQKYFAEKMFESIYTYSPSIKVISLRFSRILGTYFRDEKPTGFFAKVIESLANNERVEISAPLNKINLLDIRDAIHAILFIIFDSNWKELPLVLNIGGVNTTIKDYCIKVMEQLDIVNKENLSIISDNKKVEISSMIDTSFAKSLNWEPKYSLEETIRLIAEKLINNPQ